MNFQKQPFVFGEQNHLRNLAMRLQSLNTGDNDTHNRVLESDMNGPSCPSTYFLDDSNDREQV